MEQSITNKLAKGIINAISGATLFCCKAGIKGRKKYNKAYS